VSLRLRLYKHRTDFDAGHQTDERESLSKIPQLFAELVDGGEKLETVVRTVVALLTGDATR
jgi:hypothetical protein